MNEGRLSLQEKALKAAFRASLGDIGNSFTGEDVLVQAWKDDPQAWGLRGYEGNYPDSNKLYTKLDGKDGLVGSGFLRNVGPRTYRITEAGLLAASRLGESDTTAQVKLERQIQDAVIRILEHPTFTAWLKDAKTPAKFREIGSFWGVAPGTPPKVVRERVTEKEVLVRTALKALDAKDAGAFVAERGSKRVYEREDLERCLAFLTEMKARFRTDLMILDPAGVY